MDDRSWMYRDLPEGLHMMDYYNETSWATIPEN
jgi:hypothetical protein